jgi:hypothetical protein
MPKGRKNQQAAEKISMKSRRRANKSIAVPDNVRQSTREDQRGEAKMVSIARQAEYTQGQGSGKGHDFHRGANEKCIDSRTNAWRIAWFPGQKPEECS